VAKTLLKMADVRRLEFEKFWILVKWITAIFIGIRCCAPNFIKVGQFFIEIWRYDFKMAAVRNLKFGIIVQAAITKRPKIPSLVTACRYGCPYTCISISSLVTAGIFLVSKTLTRQTAGNWQFFSRAILLHLAKICWSRKIACWVMYKNDFQDGNRSPSWI